MSSKNKPLNREKLLRWLENKAEKIGMSIENIESDDEQYEIGEMDTYSNLIDLIDTGYFDTK